MKDKIGFGLRNREILDSKEKGHWDCLNVLPQLIPVLHDRATVAAVGLSYEVNPAMQIVARRKENWYNSIEWVGADGFL